MCCVLCCVVLEVACVCCVLCFRGVIGLRGVWVFVCVLFTHVVCAVLFLCRDGLISDNELRSLAASMMRLPLGRDAVQNLKDMLEVCCVLCVVCCVLCVVCCRCTSFPMLVSCCSW